MWPRLHGVNNELVPAIEYKDDGFEQSPLGITPESKFPPGPIIVEVHNPHCP